MGRIHTYYDNLKVSRDAPEAVIRAAYRALAQQCHPDKNPNSAEAARVMKLVNEAYAALSDPAKRFEHDVWIAESEGVAEGAAGDSAARRPAPAAARPQGQTATDGRDSRSQSGGVLRPLSWVAGLFVVAMVLNGVFTSRSPAPRKVSRTAAPEQYQPAPTLTTPGFEGGAMKTPPRPIGDSLDALTAATDATGKRANQQSSATVQPEIATSEQPLQSRGTKSKKWSEVAASPAFRAMTDAEKDAARQAYFNEVIAPVVAPDKFDAAREQFYRDSGFGTRRPAGGGFDLATASPLEGKQARKPAPPSGHTADPEQQSRSGYVPGAPRTANGGMSTFAVDNAKGERDAVVRLYLGGKRPPSRSLYVKQGEKFTARSLSPGTYVMRYRFIGNEDTYEAQEQFVLNEYEVEGGRRFSSVTVTLFTSTDGNLPTKKVPPEQF